MRHFLIQYYVCILLLLFILYNFVLNLFIKGPLYDWLMFVAIVGNAFTLTQFRKKIKYKGSVCLCFVLIWLFSKNVLQCFFAISNIIILCITGFKESKTMKIITICIFAFHTIFFLPILFLFALCFGTDLSNENNSGAIYKDTHYLCENHYEAYIFSQGAMDKFHYAIRISYEILRIDGMIDITYRKEKEISKQEYEKYIKKHSCNLVGDKNEFTKNF